MRRGADPQQHEVWLLPNGQKFTRAKTPGDRRAEHHNLSDLKHALGIVKTETTNGQRRAKKLTTGKDRTVTYERANGPSLAHALRATGVTEEALKDDIALLQERIIELEDKLDRTVRVAGFLARVARQREQEILLCSLCRLRRWWKGFPLKTFLRRARTL